MDRKEILLYLRTSTDTSDEKTLRLVDEAAEIIEKTASPKTLYRIFDCVIRGDTVTVGGAEFKSSRLAQNLEGCKRVIVFGATLGLEADRLIKTALATDTARAAVLNAAASAYIEEVCDSLEESIKNELGVTLRRRYSPGYFDLDITEQKKLFSLIDITKRIGITLSESCQMMPSKSVTAFIGIEDRND